MLLRWTIALTATFLALAKDDGFDYSDDGDSWEDDPRCKDSHKDCGLWASKNECEMNPSFMQHGCPVACNSCYLLNPAENCERAPDAVPLITAGGVKEEFTRILKDYQHLEPKLMNSESDPWMIYFDKFLPEEDIDKMLAAYTEAGHEYARSAELDSNGQDSGRRTSTSMPCNSAACWNHPAVLKVAKHVAEVTNVPLENQEFVQIVRYHPGEKYVDHHDTSGTYKSFPQGHRIYTLFVYYTDVDEGGETNFPQLNIAVKPKKGAAVLWANVQNEDPDQLAVKSQHAALPVKAGLKIAANMWLYQYNYRDPWKCQWFKSLVQGHHGIRPTVQKKAGL